MTTQNVQVKEFYEHSYGSMGFTLMKSCVGLWDEIFSSFQSKKEKSVKYLKLVVDLELIFG